MKILKKDELIKQYYQAENSNDLKIEEIKEDILEKYLNIAII